MLSISGLLLIISIGASGPNVPDGFPPLPNFQKRINYIAWYKHARRVGDKDNAYLAYAKFMPGLVGSTVPDSDWPTFDGMHTAAADQKKDQSPKWDGPMPWDPRRHPRWEASYQRTKSVLKKYAAAAKKKTLVALADKDGNTDNRENLLLSVMLPQLTMLKNCAKGTMEGAWRMKDGLISGKRFIRAVHTNLRVANQMKDSRFLIEHLVAISIRSLTYRDLRWALAHRVLAKKRINKLAQWLRKNDRSPINPSLAVPCECAILLDELQYVYGPLAGGPKLNSTRYREVTGQNMGATNRFGLGARLQRDLPAAAKAIRDAHVAMIPHMQPGYGNEHAKALSDLYERMKKSSKATQALLLGSHGYGGAYQAAAQGEADRRATHLLAELFAYKARKGKWPKRLDALGKRADKLIKQDVFRDKPFVYVLGKDGPMLYSVALDGKDDGGRHNDHWVDGDYVFWPIPDSAALLAASRLNRVPDEKLTPLSEIDKDKKKATVTVAAEINSLSSVPSKKHGQRFSVELSQDGATIELFYYQSVADKLTDNQRLTTGRHIRVKATVVQSDGALRLHLTDPLNLAIEE